MAGPFLETALPELPFLVSDQHDPFDQRSHRNDVAVVDLEPHHLQVVFDIAREDELNTLDLFWKQVERIAPIDIPRDFLSEVGEITDSLLPIDHTRHRVATSVRGFDNGGPLVIGDVAKPKRDAVLFKDMPHRNAEWRPGKLNEREHGVYMTEAEGNFNIAEILAMNRRHDLSSRGAEEMMVSRRAEEGMGAADLLCSRNARPKKALVGRAQWKISQPPSLKRERASLEGSSVTSFDGRT